MTARRLLWSLSLLAGVSLLSWSMWPRWTLLVNATFLTMNRGQPSVEAVLLRGGRIASVGTRAELESLSPAFTRVLDLQGRHVLPGFIDAHSHFPSSGLSRAFLDLSPPPVGAVDSLQYLLSQIAHAASKRSAGEWVLGFNYDDSALDIRRHPTRIELDRVAPDHPVYLWHRSGHMGVANSRALAELGYRDRQPGDPVQGGSRGQPGRDLQGRLSGLLQEQAAPALSKLLARQPLSSLLESLFLARDEYLASGVTTVQNGFADMPSLHLLRWAQRLGLVPQRVIAWPAFGKVSDRLQVTEVMAESIDPASALQQSLNWQVNSDRFTLSALKLVLDGSPQGRTAWLTEPYLPGDGHLPGYRGYPLLPQARFMAQVLEFHRAGIQLAMHGNGDAAIDLILESLQAAQLHYPRDDIRHIVVHAQIVREDQLAELARLGATVTFFPSHTYYWGDWYRKYLLGEQRARHISPLALADSRHVPYSLHSDAPVTPISPLQILWSATRRETLEGIVLGPEHRIERERALLAMTIDAAWQNHLDHDRGSLEPGKLADLVVLSGDPLSEPDVRDLRVEQVWIGGKNVYQFTPDGVGPRPPAQGF